MIPGALLKVCLLALDEGLDSLSILGYFQRSQIHLFDIKPKLILGDFARIYFGR